MRLTRTLPCQAEAILKTRDDDTRVLAVLWLPLRHNTGCKMRLMLLEDDATLGEGLRDFLQAEGHHVDWSRTLHEARTWDDGAYDALLVDWQLPDGSGVDERCSHRRRIHWVTHRLNDTLIEGNEAWHAATSASSHRRGARRFAQPHQTAKPNGCKAR